MSALRNRKVLVLNKGWSAIRVVSLERALIMLFSCHKDGNPKARIIDPTKDFQTFTWADWSAIKPKKGEDTISSTKMSFRIPEVILLSKYDKLPQHKTHFSRKTIFKRDDNTCQYCGCKPGTSELSIDHILPRSRGGKTTWENCCLSCNRCNAFKADRTPEECGLKLLKKPLKPVITIFKGEIKLESWNHFISEMYWNTELQNDNK